MKQCVDDRFHARVAQADRQYELQQESHKRIGRAHRAQIWSQFFQSVREVREKYLSSLNQTWYETQTARRNAHSLPDRVILFPKDPTQRTRNAMAYNAEVSALASVAKYEGFPAAPDMKGATASEIEDDFDSIKVKQLSTTLLHSKCKGFGKFSANLRDI